MHLSAILEHIKPISIEQLQSAFGSARTKLQNAMSMLDDYEHSLSEDEEERAKELLSNIRDLDASSSWTELLQVHPSLPSTSRNSFRDFRERLKRAYVSLSELAEHQELPPVDTIKEELRCLSEQLDVWEERAIRARRRRSYFLASASLIMLIGGPTFIAVQYLHGTIEPESVAFMFPIDPSNEQLFVDGDNLGDDTVYSLPDSSAFMVEFSRFYFGLSNNLTQHFFEARHKVGPAPRAPSAAAEKGSPVKWAATSQKVTASFEELPNYSLCRWKFVLCNSSMRRDHFVSEVRETVECLEERQFPWSELITSPTLEISLQRTDVLPPRGALSIRMNNNAIAPAIRLRWQIQAQDGEPLSEGRHFLLRPKTAGFTSLLDPNGNWDVAFLLHADHGDDKETAVLKSEVLVPPFYGDSAPSQSPSPSDVPIKKGAAMKGAAMKGGKLDISEFERVVHLERLEDLADKVLVGGEVVVSLSYEDMKNNKKEVKMRLPLPDDVVLFRPRPARPLGAAQKGGAAMKGIYYAIANAFTPPPHTRHADRTLTGSIELDLDKLESGMSTSGSLQFDSYLAPQGRISIVTTALHPKTGLYRVSVHVNGDKKIQFKLATVVPELRKFPFGSPGMEASEINLYRRRIGEEPLEFGNFREDLRRTPEEAAQERKEPMPAAPVPPAPVVDPAG